MPSKKSCFGVMMDDGVDVVDVELILRICCAPTDWMALTLFDFVGCVLFLARGIARGVAWGCIHGSVRSSWFLKSRC